MTWNYRIVYERSSKDDAGFSIREVYYDDTGNITGWTGEVSPHCEEIEDLKKTLLEIEQSEPLMIVQDNGQPKMVLYDILARL